MKKIIPILIIIMFLLLLGFTQSKSVLNPYKKGESKLQIAPNNANISYRGRWHETTVSGALTKINISNGNGFYFKVSGTTSINLDIQLPVKSPDPVEPSWNELSYYEVSIDGGSYQRIPANGTQGSVISLPIATGLTTAEHTVDVVIIVPFDTNRWETYQGCRLQGITIETGATISQWDRNYAGKALVIGDSIAEGQLGLSPYASDSSCIDGLMSYLAQLNRSCNMEFHNHSFGGSGLSTVEPFGNIPQTYLNYPYAMNGVSANDNGKYDWVIVEVCNNDADLYWRTGLPQTDSATFRNHYGNLIDQIKTTQPQATIFCISNNPYIAPERHNDVQYVAQQKGAVFIDAIGWTAYTDRLHPTRAQATVIANAIKPEFDPYVPSVSTTIQPVNPPAVEITPKLLAKLGAFKLGTVKLGKSTRKKKKQIRFNYGFNDGFNEGVE